MTRDAALAAGLSEPSLPRSNGTLTFAEPWQGRALAMAVVVVERSGRGWDDFRRELVAAIADDPDGPYWDSWVIALEQFVHRVNAER